MLCTVSNSSHSVQVILMEIATHDVQPKGSRVVSLFQNSHNMIHIEKSCLSKQLIVFKSSKWFLLVNMPLSSVTKLE